MNIGVVGCGAIGSEVVRAACDMDVDGIWVHDVDPDATAQLADLPKVTVASDPAALIAAVDLDVECANKGVVQTLARDALAAGKDVMLLTIGALADDDLRDELTGLARAHGGKIHLPSGAVMGIDGLAAASEASVHSVTLVTTKPPHEAPVSMVDTRLSLALSVAEENGDTVHGDVSGAYTKAPHGGPPTFARLPVHPARPGRPGHQRLPRPRVGSGGEVKVTVRTDGAS